MLPGNPLPVSLATLSSVLSALRLFGDLSIHCGWEDSWLFSHCFLRWDAEPFPQQSAMKCQVFSSPAAPNNGDRSGARSQTWRGSSRLPPDSTSKGRLSDNKWTLSTLRETEGNKPGTEWLWPIPLAPHWARHECLDAQKTAVGTEQCQPLSLLGTPSGMSNRRPCVL